MAHEITAADSMLYAVGTDVPWHGLGQEVDPSIPLNQMASKYNLDWEVTAEQMFRLNRVSDRPQYIPVEDKVALVRSDNDFVLGDATTGYVIFNNTQGFLALQELIDSGKVKMNTVGSLKGGKIVWGLLTMDDSQYEVDVNDIVARHILFSWGHDGKTGMAFGFTDVRTVCANTIRQAWSSELSRLLRVTHRGNVQGNVDMIVKAIDTSNMEFRATISDYKKMLNTHINQNDIRSYVKAVLQLEEKDTNKRATNLINKVSNLSYLGVGNGPYANTVWGAFNGISEFLSHQSGRNADNRMTSLWFGSNAGVLRRAHSEAMKLAA